VFTRRITFCPRHPNILLRKEHDMNSVFITPNDCPGPDDSASIQNAVDRAHETGLNLVLIPRINERTGKPLWRIARDILLPSDMTVLLVNCRLEMEDDVYSGFFRNTNFTKPETRTPEGRQYNITIKGIGKAVLDGGKANDLCEAVSCKDGHPHVMNNTPILFVNVEGFVIDNICITNQRYWGMRFEYCSRGRITNYFTCVANDRRNQDGLNLRNGCHDILIENVMGQTGDDLIAFSAIDVTRKDRWNLVVEGEDPSIHDITVRNVSGAAVGHPLIAMRCANGAKLYNILIENAKDIPFFAPVQLSRAGKQPYPRYGIVRIGGNGYSTYRTSVMGEICNITVRDITSCHSRTAVIVNAMLRDIKLYNINGSGTCRSLLSIGPDYWEQEKKTGVTIENMLLDGAHLQKDKKGGTILDFSILREGDYIKDLHVQNVFAENTASLADICDICTTCDIRAEHIVSNLPEGTQIRTVKEEESEWYDKENYYALPAEAE